MKTNKRIYVLSGFFAIAFCVVVIRLFFIQIVFHGDLNEKANSQQIKINEVSSPRGTIYNRNGKELAVSLNVKSLYAIPSKINFNSEKKIIASALSRVFNTNQEFFYEKLNKKSKFVWLKRKISPFEVEKIERYNLPCIGFVNETKRFYPNQELACHVIGFAGLDNTGLEGVELSYDKFLMGGNGWIILNKDALGREIISNVKQYSKPKTGAVVTLTIDDVIQHITETELKKTVQKYRAKSGSAIVMDPYTGEILALANFPSFNLNSFYDSDTQERRNRVVADAFEPGSTFKIVTAAAAIESGIVKEDDKIYCENGEYKIFDRTIHDHEPRGLITFKDVIKYSNNIGTVKIGMKLGNDVICKYAKKFGFGELTNIDLPGEVKGTLRDLNKWTKASIAAVPIGQEVSATSIQLVCAFSGIANGGLLVKPAIVKSVVKDDEEIFKFKPTIVRRIIDEKTARRITEILKAAVKEGTGTLADIYKDTGYEVAGKTGTAQKMDTNTGDYSESKFVSSFIGFVPANSPKFVLLVVVDEPAYAFWGGSVAGPVFKEVSKKTLRYLDMQREGKKYAAK